ncbi:hypothetical protein CHS0354_013151 [Potamilus streckersoni]|uniref:Uncharacterized protein n=1 Tax=Potamilus streckersoni TaxID=2493646 RepID=A0AAE0T976_9BIVA|nr:hypothetical protein CHS0354_013151 [Potamilus streckersoni]
MSEKSYKSNSGGKSVSVKFRFEISDIWQNPNLVLNMATSWAEKIPAVLLTKVPYVSAVTLLMLLAERAKNETYPPLHPKLIYLNLGLYIFVGILMSLKVRVKEACLLYVGQLIFMTYNVNMNSKMNYLMKERYKISLRCLGCMGIFILYVHLQNSKNSSSKKNAILRRIGELVIGFYLVLSAYYINDSYEDKRAIQYLFVGHDWSRYFITLIYAASGVCFLSGYFLKDISLSLVFLLLLYTGFVDLRIDYWQSRGILFWDQIRLIVDHVTLIIGFIYLSSKYDNEIEVDKLL